MDSVKEHHMRQTGQSTRRSTTFILCVVVTLIGFATLAPNYCFGGEPAIGQWFLVAARNAGIEKEHRLTTGSEWQSIYATTLDTRKNDILRMRGQVEVTNDFRYPLVGAIRIVVNGKVASPTVSQNCTSSFSGHHMPLWCDAYLHLKNDGFAQVDVQYRAEFVNTSARVKLERGYGHLVVEHYRHFSTLEEAKQAGARGLINWQTDSAVDRKDYGGSFAKRALAFNLGMKSVAGDIVRLTGQSTAGWIEGELEMHGQAILINNRVTASPWATENAARSSQFVPLATDGLHQVNYAGNYQYAVSMHGVRNDLMRPIIPACGHLTALQFRRLDSLIDDVPWGMTAPPTSATPTRSTIKTNAGFQVVSKQSLSLNKRDLLRITGMVDVQYPSDYSKGEGIFCKAVSEVVDARGVVVARSAYWPKYITRHLKNLPLRTEQVFEAATDGEFTIQLSVIANREDADIEVPVGGNGTQLIIEKFSQTTMTAERPLTSSQPSTTKETPVTFSSQ